MRGYFPLLIQNEEEVDDPINEKWVSSLIIDPKQTKIILKQLQIVGNGSNN
jgi:hypothetical protein